MTIGACLLEHVGVIVIQEESLLCAVTEQGVLAEVLIRDEQIE